MDFTPRYPFLIEQTNPIGSIHISNYVQELSDDQAMRQLENTAVEEGMVEFWIPKLQHLRDETIKIMQNLTRYTTRLGNLKTLLENRVGIRIPQFEQADLREELMIQYVENTTQTENIDRNENQGEALEK